MGVNSSADSMLKEAEKQIKKDLQDISKLIKKDFLYQGKKMVYGYYGEYDPLVYQRTWNLAAHVLNKDVAGIATYGAFIKFSSENMAAYDMGGNKDIVFASFMEGIHGSPSVFTGNNVSNIMDEFQNNYKSTLDKYFLSRGYIIN